MWTKPETLQLIDAYGVRLNKFKDPKIRNIDLWKEIADSLKLGYSWQQCEGRWKTIWAAYKRTNDHNNVSGNNAIIYEYENEIRTAVGEKRNINPAHILNSQDPQSFGLDQSSSSTRRPSFSRQQLLNEPSEDDVTDDNPEPSNKAS